MLKSNDYFDGKVKSIAFDRLSIPATVGVMSPGEYTFNTTKNEEIRVISGAMTVLLPEAVQTETFNEGEVFRVPANSAFQVKIMVDTAYLCLYS